MGLGAVLTAPDGTRHTLSQATGTRGCNNEAELLALMAALRQAQAHGATALQVYCDNSILVEQLGVAGSKPIARLARLFDEARTLIASFDKASLRWIPRHRNSQADALSRAALGLAAKETVNPGKKKRR
ncbi:MAG: ribonuclease [Polaromonas sp.]|nr:ribonuclease [Polaromonas sp.]